METTLRIYIISLFLTLSLASYSQKEIVILHTNDTHSRIEPLPKTDKYSADKGGVVRRANYIDQVRKENKNVLLFDAGDFLQGTPYFNLFKGEIEVKSMNHMGYDAVTLGNHEFDYGLEVLEKVARLAKFPIVSSNYDFSETKLNGLIKPFIIIRKGGVKIGVIGINIQPKGLIAANNYKGVKYLDPIKTANDMAQMLRVTHNCDMVICISHLGHNPDLNLAESTTGIDLIIGGHSHTFMKTPSIRKNIDENDVLVFQTNGRGVYVGRIDVKLEKAK
ncbi:MAG: metallophosphoesterase [Fermentimonas sp.]|nr:metallophosphoesterase [Fermentimonas sp.]